MERVPFADDQRGRICGCGRDVEPEGITHRVGCCFASEDEMPSSGDVFYALELGGGGEGEQVDATKDTWRKV